MSERTYRIYFGVLGQGGIWMTLSRADVEALSKAMETDNEATIRDVISGIAFTARRADCGLNYCNCSAEIVSPSNIRQALELAAVPPERMVSA